MPGLRWDDHTSGEDTTLTITRMIAVASVASALAFAPMAFADGSHAHHATHEGKTRDGCGRCFGGREGSLGGRDRLSSVTRDTPIDKPQGAPIPVRVRALMDAAARLREPAKK